MINFDLDQPQMLWRLTGILSDEKNRKFLVHVAGKKESDVAEFAKYQLEEREGTGIQVTFGAYEAAEIEQNDTPPDDTEPIKLDVPDLSIGISRFDIVDAPELPYKITYNIDPPIGPNKSLEFAFDNQDTANVLCKVGEGTVKFGLFEESNPRQFTRRGADTLNAGEEHRFIVRKSFTGSWKVVVNGVGPINNAFSLAGNKIVD